MKGRKPTPTALKILRGNPGQRPLNRDEPTPAPLAADPIPDELVHREARAEWQRLVPGLIACGQVTVADRALLIGYCLKYGQWLRLEDAAAAEAPIVEGSTGSPVINPTYKLANAMLDLVMRASTDLGLTPTSRARVTKAATAPAVSKWAGALP
jgi:P27 family predicted phage terminase small subunit